jgi:membrane-associated phospholipid phosphatase
MSYTPIPLPGYHRPDPLHPNQGFDEPDWGLVKPFTLNSSDQFLAPNFVGDNPQARLAWLQSPEYIAAFLEVQAIGSENSAVRTADQTEIGIFWAYDGSPKIGTNLRLDNQVARTIATQMGNTEVQNARLFALVNLAMGDAGISAWTTKYHYSFWRPIVAIRATSDPTWTPLGSPADNNSGTNFTPNFPSYVSGHVTFGSALFEILRRYYGTDAIPFSFQSDEFNGVTRDQYGMVRPARTRCYGFLTEAELEVWASRIYLGIHWRFDEDQGMVMGRSVADHVFDNFLRPR